MSHSFETSEHRPWDVQSVLDRLDRIHPIDAGEICRELGADGLASALNDAISHQVEGKRRLTAAALLLMLNNNAGREPFLAALGGPDGELRNLAVEYLEYSLAPRDLDLGWRVGRTNCPLKSDEVFDAVKRDLHEPWTDLRAKVLRILYWQDYPQVRPLTRKLLAHRDATLRREVAESYLRAGRDEGAFAVLEQMLRKAPAYLSHRDPRWHDFYHIKGIWSAIEEAATRGEPELRTKAARLAMELAAKSLGARDASLTYDVNDGLIVSHHVVKAIAAVMPSGAGELLERMITSDALSEYDRGEALLAYSKALGQQARPVILAALRNRELRERAADALGQLAKDSTIQRTLAR
jgi:hypothetical protein